MREPIAFSTWGVWAGLLVLLYLAVAFVERGRTLLPDEIWALMHAGEAPETQLQAIRSDLVHPPLIYWLQRVWLDAFGHTDGVAKALAVLVTIPTLVLFTGLATRVTPHWRCASFLFCSTYLHAAGITSLVRMYGLLLLLAVGSVLLWQRWRATRQVGVLAAWATVAVLMVYTHYCGLLLVVAFAVVSEITGPRRWLFVGVAVLVGCAIIPWMLYIYPVYAARGLGPSLGWVDANPLRALARLPFRFLTGIPPGWNPAEPGSVLDTPGLHTVLVAAAGLLHVALLALAMRSLPRLWARAAGTWRWVLTLVILLGVPVLVLYGFSVLVTPAFNARFLVGVLPAYWLLVVVLGELGGRAGMALVYGAFVPWVAASAAVSLFEHAGPSSVRQAAVRLAREVREDDWIICTGMIGLQFYWDWTRWLGGAGHVAVIAPHSPLWSMSVLPITDTNNLEIDDMDRVWLVSWNRRKAASVTAALEAGDLVPQQPLRDRVPLVQAFARVSRAETLQAVRTYRGGAPPAGALEHAEVLWNPRRQ